MASPRLICKSAYIKDMAHFFELLEYSGDKIAAQCIVFKDGSEVNVNADDIITLSTAEQEAVQGIRITFKDGGRDRVISYDTYHDKTLARGDVIRYSDLTNVQDDSAAFSVDSGPHEMKDLNFFRYLSYIDGRPGVVKEDGHGLFGLNGNVDIEDAKAMAAEHEQSCKWSHIISMDGQDAADTGFDNRAAWKNLIVSKAPEIAKTYAISLENLVINCAYHANTDNPHIHLMFYSRDSTEGFVKGGIEGMNRASEHLKSTLVNTIFKNETAELGKEKSMHRAAMKQQMQAQLASLMQSSVSSFIEPLEKLSDKLEGFDGKKVYDYLPPEVKTEVNSLVETIITQSPDLAAIFERYCDVQEKMIGRYVISPDALQEKLSQFKTTFFHPRKQDLKLYHNMVIRAASELSENRQAWLRTTEGEIVDDSTDNIDLSSPSFDDEADKPYELRTTEEEIVDDSTDNIDLSSPSFDDGDNAAQELRATEEETLYDSTDSLGLSSCTITEKIRLRYLSKAEWQEMNKFLKDSGKGISHKRVSRLFRQSMRGIFNPKLQNTFSQQQVLELLGSELTKGKLMNTTKKDILSILQTTDGDFREGMDALLSKTDDMLRKQFGIEASDSYMNSLNRSLQSGASYYLGCIDSYADSLDDEQYFQLLDAYKEFNNPLNKEIYKASTVKLLEGNTGFIERLEKLKAISPYLNNKICSKDDEKRIEKIACENVKGIFDTLSDQEGLQEAKEEWLSVYNAVINENMDEAISEKYCKRLSSTLSEVLRLMRPHYTVVQFAKSLNKMQFRQIVSDKELCKGLKKSVREHFNRCLTDTNSFSAAIVRQKLEKMRDNPSVQDSGELFTFMYQISKDFRNEVDNYLGNIYGQMKEKTSAAVAGAFVSSYKAELFKGKEHNPIHNSIAWYAKCLDENLFNIILRENKGYLKEINTTVVKGLWNNIEDAELLPLMQALRAIPAEDTAARQAAIKSIRQLIYLKQHEGSGEIIFDSDVERCVQSFKEHFEEHADPNTALSFEERLRTYLWQADTSCSYSYIISHFADELDTHRYENLFNVILRENKDCLKEINTTVVKGLWNNIEDAELLQLMQALRAIPAEDTVARQAAIKSIRQLIYLKQHEGSGENAFDEDVERCVQSFKEHFEKRTDPNTALGYEERLRTYLLQADTSCSYSYVISHFADELDTHRYESFLKQQLKSEEMKTYRTHLYQALQRVYQSGGESKEQLQAIFDSLHIDDTGTAAFNEKAMDGVLHLLSSPKHDMLVMKDELMARMFSKLVENGINLSLDAKEQKEIFDSFFYGDEHNTFFFREMLQKVATEGMPSPATSIFLLRRLLLDMGRAMCGQNTNAQRYVGYGSAEHSFRAKKQFKNVRFPREQEEAHY